MIAFVILAFVFFYIAHMLTSKTNTVGKLCLTNAVTLASQADSDGYYSQSSTLKIFFKNIKL